MIGAIAVVTLRSLLARRRALLMLLLAAVPVLVGLLSVAGGDHPDDAEQVAELLDAAIVATVLPLVALVFGTAAIGAELEDGSAIHLLTKPVARWRIVVAKTAAAVLPTACLAGGAALLTGLLAGGSIDAVPVTLAYAFAVVVGAVLYVAVFVALSILTSRALIIGLVYVVVWEGMLGGLFEGTRVLSIRQYMVGIVGALDPSWATAVASPLAPATVAACCAVVFGGSLVLAIRALERHQLQAGD
jgi:ABC-2 type transport system permease protein